MTGAMAVWRKEQARRSTAYFLAVFLVSAIIVVAADAQVATAKTQSQAPIAAAKVRANRDAGVVGEVPLNAADVPDPEDISLPGSPISASRSGLRIKANTPLTIKLNAAASSGAARNGDTLAATLLEPVRTSGGTVLKAGTPVKVTVLSSAKAGQIQSGGVLSLQVFQVGLLPVISNVLEFSGQEGRREVADANPEKGTEAAVLADTPLHFQVLGSGDKPDADESSHAGGIAPQTSTITPVQSTVGPPAGFTRSAPQSSPVTAIHGASTPHP